MGSIAEQCNATDSRLWLVPTMTVHNLNLCLCSPMDLRRHLEQNLTLTAMSPQRVGEGARTRFCFHFVASLRSLTKLAHGLDSVGMLISLTGPTQ
jgi:hypothetical protein